ncbi:MAG: 3-dehydroquinate synthase [Veillonella caviae]|nr:3-dehydroquinate synthase [Veillonella caviae]
MPRIHINASESYDVIIESDAIHRVTDYVQPLKPTCQVIIVTDTNVAAHYLPTVKAQFESTGYTVYDYVFPAGESSKNAHQLIDLIEYMASQSLTRKDLLVALGGGVVGDMAGFAAATYLRGIDYVQIPTSLLAAVDSSVGGKTAVNLESGKNLWGAFKQPILVLCDPTTLNTLPDVEWINGCGEIIKYGFLDVPGLLTQLENKPLITHRDTVGDVIARCVQAKADIVEQDERESGVRALLNLGHTFGHGIENASHFEVHHGYAVAIGMMLMAQGAVKNDNLDPVVVDKLKALLEAHNLPTSTSITKEEMLIAAKHDKKSEGATIKIVIPTSYGSSALKKVTHEQLAEYLV